MNKPSDLTTQVITGKMGRKKRKPCTKIKYTELSAKIKLSHIKSKLKHKQHKHKRRECASYYCTECNAWHLTSRKQ